MASSSEAFARFSMWKKDKIWLKVTVIERGKPEDVFSLRIAALDEDALLISLAGRVMHSWTNFDVGEAEFSIEPNRLVASREDVEWLIFEEEN